MHIPAATSAAGTRSTPVPGPPWIVGGHCRTLHESRSCVPAATFPALSPLGGCPITVTALGGHRAGRGALPGLAQHLWTTGTMQATGGQSRSLLLPLLGAWGLWVCPWPGRVPQATLAIGSSSASVNAPPEGSRAEPEFGLDLRAALEGPHQPGLARPAGWPAAAPSGGWACLLFGQRSS